jgi:ribosome-associated protein
MEILIENLLPNISFKTSRSGGKGGQNVNKVSSKVELNFDFLASPEFDGHQKDLLKRKLAGKMTTEGLIQIISEEERSQFLNKQRCLDKLCSLLKIALHVQKARKATKPKKSAIEKRLQNKQQKAVKKLNRSKKGWES